MIKPLNLPVAIVIFMFLVSGVASPVWAHCNEDGVHSGDHPHCSNDSGPAGGGEYDLSVTGDLISLAPLFGVDGGGRAKPVDVSFQFIDMDLGYFESKFSTDGSFCFSGAPLQGRLTAMGVGRDKDGSAFATYFFTGFGNDGTTEVSYLLEMSGSFSGNWRPDSTTLVQLTSWKMSISGTGGVKRIACTSTQLAPMNTTVVVTRTN